MYDSLLFLLSTVFLGIASLFVYRLLLHPLCKIPGPWGAALTDYYAGYYDVVKCGGLLKRIEELHVQYGPVIRIGPNTLHFAEPQAYTDIYVRGTSFTKSSQLYHCFFYSAESSVAFLSPQESRLRRSLLNPLFSRRAILKLKGVIQDKIDKFISRIETYPDGGPVNLTFGFRSLTMEIITSYCFATGYKTLEHPTFHHPLLVMFDEMSDFFWLSKYFTSVMRLTMAAPLWVTKLLNPSFLEFFHIKHDLEDRIERYLEDESCLQQVEHETIFHHLIMPETKDGIDRSLRPSKKSLLHEAFTLLGAGSDTVANACCLGTFYALDNPTIGERLKKELHQAWPDEDSVVDLTVLEQLPYLTAFIKESLRFSHGVVTPLMRTVGPSDAKICGVHVPAGTNVEMSTVFLHKNPTIFEDPETFSPDRWMNPGSKELENYLVPFSRGPRMCLGINLAWCELYLILGTIFRKLDLSLYDTTVDDFKDFKEVFVPFWKGKDLRVTVQQKS